MSDYLCAATTSLILSKSPELVEGPASKDARTKGRDRSLVRLPNCWSEMRSKRLHGLRKTLEAGPELSRLAGKGQADETLAAGTELGAAPHGDAVLEAMLGERLGGYGCIHADEYIERPLGLLAMKPGH